MTERVFITGMGMVSAIGMNVDEALESLRAGKTGIGEIKISPTLHKGSMPAGEVPHGYDSLCELVGISSKENLPRTSLLGILAVREAIQQAGIDANEARKMGLISGTTVGGMDKSEELFEDYLGENIRRDLDNVITHDCGYTTENIADATGIRGYVSTISTACSSAANALMMAARLIKSGRLDRVVAGGSDGLTRFTLNGFNSLKILSSEWCKPFDADRTGLNLGEGAAFLVLESESVVKASGKKVYGELVGYANTADSYHQTASSPDGRGARRAMEKALSVSGLSPSDIGYINVHGTATPNNDLSEGTAIRSIFGDKTPPFSSTKAFTGHTLGASGGMEAIISMLSINHGLIFPNLNFSTPIPEIDMIPQTELATGIEISAVLSNSFGFGGNCTSLVFSKA